MYQVTTTTRSRLRRLQEPHRYILIKWCGIREFVQAIYIFILIILKLKGLALYPTLKSTLGKYIRLKELNHLRRRIALEMEYCSKKFIEIRLVIHPFAKREYFSEVQRCFGYVNPLRESLTRCFAVLLSKEKRIFISNNWSQQANWRTEKLGKCVYSIILIDSSGETNVYIVFL